MRRHRHDQRLPALLLDSERLCDGRGYERGPAQGREIDEEDAVLESVGKIVSDLQPQARLADPAGAGQRHEPRALTPKESRDLCELAPTPDERCLRRGEVTTSAHLGGLDAEAWVLAQDRPLQLLQLGAGFEPELVAQRTADPVKHRERVGLPPSSIEGDHELAVETLACRMAGGERLELGYELVVSPKGQIRLDPLLERNQPELLEPRDLGLGERLVRDVGEGLTAPEPKRLT
jgi:hypothetical protein